MAYTSPFTINNVNDYLKSKLSPTVATPTPSTTTQGFIGPVRPAPTPSPTPVPSSPSATTTVKPTTTTPAPTSTSAPTANLFNNGLNPNFQTPAAQTFIGNQIPSSPAPTPSAPSTPPPVASTNFYGSSASNSAPQSAYLDFLRKQFNSADAEAANKNLMELNKRTSEELQRARKEEDRLRANTDREGESGQTYRLNENARQSNRSLADLALAKGYAQQTYDNMLAAGKTVFEAEQAAQKDFKDRSSQILQESAPALAAELKTLPDKISQDNFIRQKASELGVSIDQVNSALQAELNPTLKDLPASIQEYEYAKAQGYPGSYQQWVDRKGSGSGTTSTLKADINADVSGILAKWTPILGGNNTINSTDYKKEKAKWVAAYSGDVAAPAKQFDDLFSYLADQSGFNWQKDYGINP